MKYASLKSRRVLKLYVSIFMGVVTLFCSVPSTVHALDTKFYDDSGNTAQNCDLAEPQPNNSGTTQNYCNPQLTNQVRLSDGETAAVPLTQTYLRAYFKLPSVKSGGGYQYDPNGNTILDVSKFPKNQLKVHIYGYNWCPWAPTSANSRDGIPLNGGYYANNPLPPGGTNVTKYVVGTQQTKGTYQGSGSNACNSAKSAYTATFTLTPSDFVATQGVANLYYTEITVTHLHNNQDPTGNCSNLTPTTISDCDGAANSFVVDEQAQAVSQEDIIATASNGTSCVNSGLCTTVRTAGDDPVQPPSGSNNFMTYRVRFGADCTVVQPNSPQVYYMNFYDLDYDVNTPGVGPVRVRIHDETNNTWLWPSNGGGNVGTWKPSGSIPNYGNSYTMPYANGSASKLGFTAQPNHKYEADVMNVESNLTMQYATPFDGVYYNHDCMNPGPSAQTIVVTPVVTPANTAVEVTQPGSFTSYANISGAGGLPAGYTLNFGCQTYDPSNNPVVTATSINSDGPTCSTTVSGSSSSIGSRICATLFPIGLFWHHTGSASPNPPPGWSAVVNPSFAQGCSDVVGLSYFKVYGGDIRAGGGVGAYSTSNPAVPGGGVCPTSSTAGLGGWSHANGVGYAGSGTQLAAVANGFVAGLVSGEYNDFFLTNPTPRNSFLPNDLTYSNDTSTGYAGGYYGAAPGCTGYVEQLPKTTVTETGPVHIPDANTLTSIAPGKTIVRHIVGDLYIDHDITYSNAGGYVNVSNIPLVQFIVEGNIYIDWTVKQLDGLYVAVPPAPGAPPTTNQGNIYDCTINGTPATATWAGCGYQLVVNGSFAAGKVHLQRDCGSQILAQGPEPTQLVGNGADAQLCNVNNHAAEVFNYLPEEWIRDPQNYAPSGYDSISSMPPIL